MITPDKTKDLPANFFPTLLEVCKRIECDPLDLLSVMMSESGVNAAARNPNGNATGLIQFMPSTLKSLRYAGTWETFRHLSATKQLEWVERYYQPWKKAAGTWTMAKLYQATFLPATLSQGSDDGTVIAAHMGKLGWAYDANGLFDANKDGAITVGELGLAIKRNAKGARWNEIVARLREAQGDKDAAAVPFDDVAEGIDLRTTLGVQKALAELGFSPGPIDGIPGRKTRAAVVAFQTAAKLVADGIPGPKTKAALKSALDKPDTAPSPPSTVELVEPDDGEGYDEEGS